MANGEVHVYSIAIQYIIMIIIIVLLLLQELPIDEMFIKSFNHAYMRLGGQGERVLG